jgi:hypothetical protein
MGNILNSILPANSHIENLMEPVFTAKNYAKHNAPFVKLKTPKNTALVSTDEKLIYDVLKNTTDQYRECVKIKPKLTIPADNFNWTNPNFEIAMDNMNNLLKNSTTHISFAISKIKYFMCLAEITQEITVNHKTHMLMYNTIYESIQSEILFRKEEEEAYYFLSQLIKYKLISSIQMKKIINNMSVIGGKNNVFKTLKQRAMEMSKKINTRLAAAFDTADFIKIRDRNY